MNELKEHYKNEYLVYTRKSTDDADNQKNSIDYQRSEGVRYAKEHLLPIADIDIPGFCGGGIISERHTGFKESDFFTIGKNGTIQLKIERPKFFKLVELLHQGAFKGVIFLCMDRASRNKTDNGILDKLRKRGIELLYVQATYDDTSAGELHRDIDQVFSGHYSRSIKEKISGTLKKLRDEGVCTYRAPIGYLNTGNIRSKPFDPVRAPIVKQLFEKYADGSWSLIELAKWANEQGLTMPAMRRNKTKEEKLMDNDVIIEPAERPLNFQNVHNMLRNKYYIGLINGNDGKMVRCTSSEPLISEELFDKVQECLKSKRVSIHYINKPQFPYRGIVRCKFCSRVYTPYEQKGFDYYGARCKSACFNDKRNINTTFIEDETKEIVSQIRFNTAQLAEIDDKIKNDLVRHEEQRKQALVSFEQNARKLREDAAYMEANKLMLIKSRVYTPEQFLAEQNKIAMQLDSVQEKLKKDVSIPEFLRTLKKHSELIKTFYYHYEMANPAEKARLLRNIFSELNVFEKRLVYKCKKAFEVLELPYVKLGAPNLGISELLDMHDSFKECIKEMEKLLESP